MLLNADSYIEQALEPSRVVIPDGAVVWVFLLMLTVSVAGCVGLLAVIRRVGKPGGEIALPEFAKGVGLGFLLLVFMDSLTGPLAVGDPLIAGLLQAAASLACIFALALDPWRPREDPPPRWVFVKPRHLLMVPPLWLLAFPVLIAAMFAAVALAQMLGMPVTEQEAIQRLRADDSALWIAGWYVLAAVAAPLWEEFVFRLVLFGGLSGALGFMGKRDDWLHPGRLIALLVSGGLFVLAHGVTEWTVGVIPLGVLTLILTALYAHTRSIWPCVLFHAMHNGFVVTLQFFVLM